MTWYTVLEASALTGRAAQAIRRMCRLGRIECMLDMNVYPPQWLILAPQVAEILRSPRPKFVAFPTLEQARQASKERAERRTALEAKTGIPL